MPAGEQTQPREAAARVKDARRWLRAHPRGADGCLAGLLVLLVIPTFVVPDPQMAGNPNGWTLVLFAVGAAALVLRRERPLWVWGFTTLAGVAGVLQSDGSVFFSAATCVALWTIGRQLATRAAVFATCVSGVAYTLAAVAVEGHWFDNRGIPGLQIFAWASTASAIGIAVRSQRAALAAAEARAVQAELTREEEAVRRVSDERLRIARDLHDVVAHHISIVNVQAGVARHLLGTSPGQAAAALDVVRDASRTVLTEMSAVVGLLRTPGEDAPVEPAPGLARVGELVDSSRRAGLELTWTVGGDLDGLSAINDLTAYRVVQEALTNALRHGTGSASLAVTGWTDGIGIEVRNQLRRNVVQQSAGGHGLIGMRERVEAVGGRLTTGALPDGSYRVAAVIPRSPA